MAKTSVESYTMKYRILAVILTPQDFLLSFNLIPGKTSLRWIIKIPFAILILYGYYSIIKRNNKTQNPYFNYLNIILLILFILIIQFVLVLTSFSLVFQPKYLIISFPIFILLFSLFNEFSPLKRNLIYTIISIYFISLITLKYTYPTKTYDFKTAANFLNRIQQNKEPILFYGKSTIPPFEYYYKGSNKLIGLPELKYDKDYYEENINDTTELSSSIKMINTSTESYILVLGSIIGFNYDNPMTPEMIEISLKEQYNITLDTLIDSKNSDNTLRILRLEKKK